MNNFSIDVTQAYSGSFGGQGALYYDGYIYQFSDGGLCKVVKDDYSEVVRTFTLPAYADNGQNPHCSSVEWIIPGQKLCTTTNATGLVNYADKLYIYDITDESNITQDIVTMAVENKQYYARMACLAYDQVNKVIYITGYQSGSTKSVTSPCVFEKFDLSGYMADNTNLNAPRLGGKIGTEAGRHMQDGGFYNGYIYYLCDNSNTTNSSYDGLYIWVLDTDFNNVAFIDIKPGSNKEAEAFFMIPGTNTLKCVSNITGPMTYFDTVFAPVIVPPAETKLTLHTSLNVTGYVVNGTWHATETVELPAGTYTIEPLHKDGSTFYKWSDDVTDKTRTITVGAEDAAVELTAKAQMRTIYMRGLPASKGSYSTKGLSVSAGPTTAASLLISTNTSYPNEYMLAANEKYNEYDCDIVTTNSPKADARTYFAEEGITEGMYYFVSMPEGCTKVTVNFYNADGTDYAEYNQRNPNIIFNFGDTIETTYKNAGRDNNDVVRPITNGATYDFVNGINFKTVGMATVDIKKYSLINIRMNATSERLNDGYAKLVFS